MFALNTILYALLFSQKLFRTMLNCTTIWNPWIAHEGGLQDALGEFKV